MGPAPSLKDLTRYAVEERTPYYQKRIDLFSKYKERMDAAVETARAQGVPITITLPDGSTKAGVKGVTTPMDIALTISKGLAKNAVVAKVDGSTWDMFRNLEGDCRLSILTFNDEEGRETYWHSSAHILGEALEKEYGVDLTIGPPLEEGFYYDCYMGERTLVEEDKSAISQAMNKFIKEKQNFERVVVTREEALGMFEENKFKVELISSFPEEATITCYKVGPMVDLCSGPHIPSTSMIKAVEVTNMSRAFWRGDVQKEGLMRVYAVTFPDNKLMTEYKTRIEEAKKRDHRVLGLSQELFFFHVLSPGSCFFMPNGARIYNTLVEYIRELYWKYDYDEVVTPNIFNFDLWRTSGHAAHYKENMFGFSIEKEEFGMKPMNCPAHCIMFGHRRRTYRELPVRFADFGVLHRNEFSGALHGLTRVRRFQQDDAHIFCREDQMTKELDSFLTMLDEVYGTFGLSYEMALSTRPDDYMGELELWDRAEDALKTALQHTGKVWRFNEGDGAFYGPKIDITVFDALKRRFQCATVQLDFQQPINFNLSYATEDGSSRPVIIHRAILGSVERMFAILTEHFAGKWPLWLNPRQVLIVPINSKVEEYALEVRKAFRRVNMHAEADLSDRTMQKKVREAQLGQVNYILVVGEKEMQNRTVNVRTRDNKVHGEKFLMEVVMALAEENNQRSRHSIFGHSEEALSNGQDKA